MVANARAIARAANIAHDNLIESNFSRIADELEAAMYEILWAPEQEFFVRGCSTGFSTRFYQNSQV